MREVASPKVKTEGEIHPTILSPSHLAVTAPPAEGASGAGLLINCMTGFIWARKLLLLAAIVCYSSSVKISSMSAA